MYEIELTIGNVTHHYGSIETFREDMDNRRKRIASLHVHVMRDGVSVERKMQLRALAGAEYLRLEAINKAMADLIRKSYENA